MFQAMLAPNNRSLYFGLRHNQRTPILAIPDDFQTYDVPIAQKKGKNGQTLNVISTSHGGYACSYALLANPAIHIAPFQVDLSGMEGYSFVKPALSRLHAQLEKGFPYGAVSFSYSLGVPFSRIREDLNLPGLTPENVDQYKKVIKRNLHKIRFDKIPEYKEVMEQLGPTFIEQSLASIPILENIAKKVPTILPAGNAGPDSLNLFLLADGVLGVGALGNNGKPAFYSGRNSLVREWKPVDKAVMLHFKRNGGLRGFSLDESAPLTTNFVQLGGNLDQLDLPVTLGSSFVPPMVAGNLLLANA